MVSDRKVTRRLFSPFRGIAWKLVKSWVRRSFPTVEQISTATLANQITQDKQLVIVDARRIEEYAVSHIPGAIRATSVQDLQLINLSREDDVVVYCSIGYRSARLAQQLKTAGYTAKNLEGSLFQWANEERLLVADDGETTQVHPYSSTWGLLLKPHALEAS